MITFPSVPPLRRRRNVVVFAGDSITYADPLNPPRWPWYTEAAEVIRLKGGGPPLGRDHGAPAFIKSGVDGYTAADLLANISTLVYQHDPAAVVVYIGTNDATAGTPTATFKTSMTSIVTGCQTASNFPGGQAAQVALCTILCVGEQRPDGANAFDATAGGVQDVCARIREVATERSCELIDLRARMLETGGWSEIYNPTNIPFTGVITIDGRHWPKSMATIVAQEVASHFQVG